MDGWMDGWMEPFKVIDLLILLLLHFGWIMTFSAYFFKLATIMNPC